MTQVRHQKCILLTMLQFKAERIVDFYKGRKIRSWAFEEQRIEPFSADQLNRERF